MPHERRHFGRVSFDAPALLTTARGAFSVHVVDVSLKGALLTAPSVAELSIGMPCQLTIPLAETGTHIAMSAEVAHLQDGATGLQCRSIGQPTPGLEVRDRLRRHRQRGDRSRPPAAGRVWCACTRTCP